jgi:hypothetical protein
MYSIQVRINHRLLTLDQDQRGSIGVVMRDGRTEYFYWGGFTLHMARRIKLKVTAITNEQLRNPRAGYRLQPPWIFLDADEYLLGSFDGSLAYAMLPYMVLRDDRVR